MRELSKALLDANKSSDRFFLSKVLVSDPIVPPLGAPSFSEFSNFGGALTDVIRGISLDSGNVIILRSSGFVKVIQADDVSVPTSWSANTWVALSSIPSSATVRDIASFGSKVRVCALKTTSPYHVYVIESNDGGQSWGSWTNIGTSTIAPNQTEVRMTFDAVYVKNTNSTGLVIECFSERTAGSWTKTTRQTLLSVAYDSNDMAGFSVAKYNDVDYLLFTAKQRFSNVINLYYIKSYKGILSLPKSIFGFENPQGYFPIFRPALLITKSYCIFSGQFRYIGGDYLKDDFESYWGKYISVYDSFSSLSGWMVETAVTITTTEKAEGGSEAKFGGYYFGEIYRPYEENFTLEDTFRSSDFLVLYYRYPAAVKPTAYWYLSYQSTLFDLYSTIFSGNTSSTNPQSAFIKKINFGKVGNPSWASAQFRIALVGINLGDQAYLDYVRYEKADPDNVSYPNATGSAWNFQPANGLWTITKDDSGDPDNAMLACLDKQASVEKTAIKDTKILSPNFKIKIQVKIRNSNGKAGLIIHAASNTLAEGAENCYASIIDTSANTLTFYKYVSGNPTSLGSASFSCDPDIWYWLGADISGNMIKLYAAEYEDDLFSSALLTITDSTYTSGYVGVMSIGANTRFDNLVTNAYISTLTVEGIGMGKDPINAVLNSTHLPCTIGDNLIASGKYLYTFDRGGDKIYQTYSPDLSEDSRLALGILDDVSSHVVSFEIKNQSEAIGQAKLEVSRLDDEA